MLVTRDVSKPETSSDLSKEQPANIQFVPVTRDVSKLETSREVSEEQS